MKINFGSNQVPTDSEKERFRSQALLAKPRNFPSFLDAYLEFTKNQESTPRVQRWVAISTIASALERRVWLDAGHFKTFPNFYIFIIGDSGVIRKSTSTGIGAELLRDLGSIKMMSERITDRSLINQLQRSREAFYVNGKEIVQSAVFCYASELIVFLNKRIEGTISELLTTLWDCPPEWSYETQQDGKIYIQRPCLNILGASTPSWLQRAIPADEMEGGFASRIVFVVEPNPPERFIAFPDRVDAELKAKLLADLKQINALSGEFSYTPEARSFYETWYVKHKRATGDIKDSRFKGYYARKPITIWKLAMILSVAESNSLRFDVKHLENGLALLDDLEQSMLSAFGAAGQNKLATGIQRILELLQIRAKTGSAVTHKEVMHVLWRDYSGSEVTQILQDLKAMEDIQTLSTQSPQGPMMLYKLRSKEAPVA